jgi:hypothetical protein
VDTLLVGPGGQSSILMSDAGDCDLGTQQPAPIDLTFDDSSSPVPCLPLGTPLPGGTYSPTNDPTSPRDCSTDASSPDVFAPPAPAGPYRPGLAVFNGVNANGTWNLFTMDQFSDDSGAIDGGWSLDLTIPAATLTGAPRVKGRAEVGKKLTAVSGTLGNGAAPSYQWSRCNASGKACAAISHATRGTYRPVRRDKGHTLIVTETGVTSGGNSAPVASKPTKPVGPALLSLGGTKGMQNVLAQKGLIARVKSNIAGTLTATATVKRTVRFKTVKKRLRAGKTVTVKLRLSSGGLGALRDVLASGTKVKAKLTLTVKDTGGGKATKKLTVRLA